MSASRPLADYHDGGVVMTDQLLVALVEVRVVTIRLGYGGLQVIRYQQLRHAAEELERPHVGLQPAFLPLFWAGFDIGVAGCAQRGHEVLRLANFAGIEVDDRDRRATEVQE